MNGYKILISYYYLTHREMEYRRFMIQRWLPAMQDMELVPGELLHTLWGDYPTRLVVLYAPDQKLLQKVLGGEEWQHWHEQLLGYVHDLHYRAVRARPWLQF